ncbi:hypothetical protein [Sphingosinicella sp. BN140058]|uniref:hypothetical protein n=1 Tax=Sphingosinicella sp. BN140058 TaxID=1892855 RepID=UPI0010137810|nr:hypothetical protein [Sphingosinicella sp. BN140058]QAY78895.1 hypothetical protein ETR14_21905 [Sphingosinicella sp. BN140058]
MKFKLGRIERGTTPSLGELSLPAGRTDRHSESGEGVFARTVARNRDRLDRLRSICEDELLASYERFRRGQRLLSRSHGPTAAELMQAERDMADATVLEGRRSPLPGLAGHCFPLEDREFSLASLLQHVVVNHAGRIGASKSWATQGVRNLVTWLGGPQFVTELIEASDRALVAAYGLVSIDSAFNVQACDDLAADPFVGVPDRGRIELRVLQSTKNRPVPRAVRSIFGDGFVYLSAKNQRISGKGAIDIWLEMSAPIRERAVEESHQRIMTRCDATFVADDDVESQSPAEGVSGRHAARSERLGGARVQDWLWILPTGQSNCGEIRKASSGNFRDWWKDMLAQHVEDPVIGGLEIRRKHIRPTILQLRAAGRNGDAELAAQIANHETSATTFQNYLNRPYMRLQLTEQIRSFQSLLQVAVVRDAAAGPAKLGLSEPVFSLLREQALAAGLAFYSELDLDSPSELEVASCGVDSGPIAYSDTVPAMRSAALLRCSMDAAAHEFAVKAPERWAKVWLPLHALSIAVWDALMSGSRRRTFQEVVGATKAELEAGVILPFKPW